MVCRIIIIVCLVLMFVSCPTPFGILVDDSIIHYNGDVETIEEWLKGNNPWIDDTDETQYADVTVIINWGE